MVKVKVKGNKKKATTKRKALIKRKAPAKRKVSTKRKVRVRAKRKAKTPSKKVSRRTRNKVVIRRTRPNKKDKVKLSLSEMNYEESQFSDSEHNMNNIMDSATLFI